MDIRIATTAAEFSACYQVMRELRNQFDSDTFVDWVHEQANQGYVLVYIAGPSGPVSVAGYRVRESLAWGRYLQVEDITTLAAYRSKRMGSALAKWLINQAQQEGCQSVHVDSPLGAEQLQRFCERQGFQVSAQHYSLVL
ncbi:MAG: GNAT family N-acetyltransferase [Moraxellaceae bacterium]|nr:GNAT family N-acetyltransferase [Moraxellaceae bacterium]MDP1775858.1 GNAT family N-acetyltransferase [Moraxellaceae bacterium]MDZ4297253.1 GNAT family N-acetyltransferase [Moraxellaceae bacterium]MDZ4386233.1 GNAT family N-acetyltransferase [Moraxellaceae bacterium]